MTQEDSILVPRWFLEVVEDTLRIQNSINLDKKTGETCQDRNIRQALNGGGRKLLNGGIMTHRDEIDKFLFDVVGVLPGCCSSIESMKYTIARTVAEALWPKKDLALTINDLELLHIFLYAIKNNKQGCFTFTRLSDEQYEEVLRRFNEAKK